MLGERGTAVIGGAPSRRCGKPRTPRGVRLDAPAGSV